MFRKLAFCGLILLVVCFYGVSVVMAQDSTAEPLPSPTEAVISPTSEVTPEVTAEPIAPAVIVINMPEAPTPENDLNLWNVVIQLIEAGVAVTLGYFLFKSAPPETRAALDAAIQARLDDAGKSANNTETYIDNLAVEAAKFGYKLVRDRSSLIQPPDTTPPKES